MLPYKSLLAPQTHRTDGFPDGFHGNHEFKLPKDQGPLRGGLWPRSWRGVGDCDSWLRTSFSGLWPLERNKDLFLGIMIAALKRSRNLSQGLWPTPLERSQGSDPPFPAALVTSLVILPFCWSTSSPTPLPHKLLGCWFLMGWEHGPKFFG